MLLVATSNDSLLSRAARDIRAALALDLQASSADAALPKPHAGPQGQFVESDADIVVYGGAAGGGKTWGLLMTPVLKRHIRNPGFGAVIFRRTYPDITAEGGMWDESEELYEPFGAKSRENPLERRFPSGAKIRFAHMQHVKDRLRWKGSQIPYIAFDQLEEFEAPQFWYLLSRNRSLCGVRPYIRATVNPDPDSWVKEFLAPWVDDRHPEFPFPPGTVRHFARDGDTLMWVDAKWRDPDGQPATTLTYIPATIYDNPTLLASNPQYLTRLRSLPLVDRARLLDGDWNMRYEGNMFKREWFKIVEQAPARFESIGRAWDLAGTTERPGTDPDWTVGVKAGYLAGVWYVLDVVRVRASPAGVDMLMDQTAALDGPEVEIHLQQDPGEAGLREVQGHARRLKGYIVRWRRPTGDKVTRAKPLAASAEAGNVVLVAGEWNRDFINECVAFPGKRHDDQVDAASWEMLMQAFPDGQNDDAPIPAGSGPRDWIASAKMTAAFEDGSGGATDDDDYGGLFIS